MLQKDWQDLPAVMTVEETARFLRRGYRCILNLCHTNGFPALRIGRTWRINRDGLKRWLEAQIENAGDDRRQKHR